MREKENILSVVKSNILKNNLISNNDVLIIGVSGGPDSMFLLYALSSLKKEFEQRHNIYYDVVVCHINHMIREESTEDQQFVEQKSRELGYKFFAHTEDVKKLAKELKISEEECGRNVRYDFFEKTAKENGGTKIIVAHNANDNAETILFNMLRGAGTSGMCGMKMVSNGIIRPVLNIKKKDILEYLSNNNIEYKEDKTNKENNYTRNKIRNLFIKTIENEYNPNIIETLNGMAEVVSQDEYFIEKHVDNVYSATVKSSKNAKLKEIYIDIEQFNREDIAIKNRIIRKVISNVNGDIKGISRIHINDIVELLNKHIKGKRFYIGNKFEVIIKNKKEAIIKRTIGNNIKG